MNCKEVDAIVTDLARGVASNELALAHIKECRACAGRLAEEQRLSEGLLAWAKMSIGEQAPPDVEEKLLRSYRPQVPVRSKRRWIALAAAGSLAASALLFRFFTAESPVVPAAAGPAEPPRVATVLADSAEPAPVAPLKAKSRRVRRRALPAPDPEPALVVAHFLPVVQGDSWTPLDGGRVVRVKLPRSALLVFGLPMNEERALEQVQADVMLSNDGLLRGIRFVQ